MKPMLARPWDEKLISFPAYVQPKLNGLRCMYEFSNGGLWSRDQHQWGKGILPHIYTSLESEATKEVLRFIATALAPHKLLGLDGEVYCHGMSLQQINSRGAVVRQEPHKEHYMLSFHVFDLISMAPFALRAEALQMLEMVEIPGLSPVPTHYCGNEQTFNELYEFYLYKEKYEGVMWRNQAASYGFAAACTNRENRWKHIVKRKPRLDMNVMILRVIEGEGKHSGMVGSFECATSHGVRFTVGSGLDEVTRRAYWEMDHSKFVGQTMRIDYEMLSDSLTPLKPTISCVNVPIEL